MIINSDKYSLTPEDQLWIQKNLTVNDGPFVSGNDTYKLRVNFELTENKLQVINLLTTFSYITPIYKISDALSSLFEECESKPGHWSYIAENYTCRSINRVIEYMIKQYGNWSSLQNPAAYFTKSIRYRKTKRRKQKI